MIWCNIPGPSRTGTSTRHAMIEVITVNHWPRGHRYKYNAPFDPEWPEDQRPNVIGLKRFGRISIANTDSAATQYPFAWFDFRLWLLPPGFPHVRSDCPRFAPTPGADAESTSDGTSHEHLTPETSFQSEHDHSSGGLPSGQSAETAASRRTTFRRGQECISEFDSKRQEFDEPRILLDQPQRQVFAYGLEYGSCSSAMNSDCPHSGNCNCWDGSVSILYCLSPFSPIAKRKNSGIRLSPARPCFWQVACCGLCVDRFCGAHFRGLLWRLELSFGL